jgi:hypothetical protein
LILIADYSRKAPDRDGPTARVFEPVDRIVGNNFEQPQEDLANTDHAHLATGGARPATSQPSEPDGSGFSPHPPGTDAESFMTPADTLSCHPQTNPETPKVDQCAYRCSDGPPRQSLSAHRYAHSVDLNPTDEVLPSFVCAQGTGFAACEHAASKLPFHPYV